jgi:hypothetical protein
MERLNPQKDHIGNVVLLRVLVNRHHEIYTSADKRLDPRVKPTECFDALPATLIKHPVRFTLRARTHWIKMPRNWRC